MTRKYANIVNLTSVEVTLGDVVIPPSGKEIRVKFVPSSTAENVDVNGLHIQVSQKPDYKVVPDAGVILNDDTLYIVYTSVKTALKTAFANLVSWEQVHDSQGKLTKERVLVS